MKLRYGDILCFRPTTFNGKLIVFFDSKGLGQYSHNAVFLEYKQGVPLFLEVHEKNERGAAIQQLLPLGNYDVYRPTIKPIPKREALKLLNRKYDARRLWRIFLHRVFGFPIRPDNSNKMICSELVNVVYSYRLLEPGTETPWEFEKLAQRGVIHKLN